jgi:hypothetical protein
MGYNYLQAFTEQPQQPEICENCIRNIAATAIIHYKHEFPDVQQIHCEFYLSSKHVECTGAAEPRLYSFKQLGFPDAC